VNEILIYKFHEGIFYAKLICERDGQVTEIDSRTSDAIAIGVRFNAPIYTLSKVLEDVSGAEHSNDESFDFEEEETESDHAREGDVWKEVSKEELSTQLSEALENEDYELASKIRDEIKRRD
jgi:bifunctional DNase/RNase